jgi:anti-sigma B factor antagonist
MPPRRKRRLAISATTGLRSEPRGSAAKEALGYEPSHDVTRGINETIGPRLARASALASIDPGAPRHFARHEPCVFHCQSPMTHSLSREMDTALLRVRGVLDALSCPELRLVLDGLVEERKPAVTVDLSELRLIDSFGVGAMVSLYKRVRANGGEVRFVGVTAQPLRHLQALPTRRARPSHDAPEPSRSGIFAVQ